MRIRPLNDRVVKAGDKVLFGEYAGDTVQVHGEELLVMREDDIMGILDDRAGANPRRPK